MITRLLVAAVAFSLSFSSLALAQDAAKKEMKMENKKETLKSVSCDPACGFSVRSHDEKELISMVKEHAKTHHNMDMTDEQVRKMMKEEKMDHTMDKKPEAK